MPSEFLLYLPICIKICAGGQTIIWGRMELKHIGHLDYAVNYCDICLYLAQLNYLAYTMLV